MLDAALLPLFVLFMGPGLMTASARLLRRALPPAPGAESQLWLPLDLITLGLCSLVYAALVMTLGPELVPRRGSLVAQGVAIAGSAAVALVGLRERSRLLDATTSAPPGSVGTPRLGPALWPASGAFGVAAATLLWETPRPYTLWAWAVLWGLIAMGGELRRRRAGAQGASVAGIVLALTLAVTGWAAGASALSLTQIGPEAVANTSPERARRRIRVAPWDGDARLAMAWCERRSGHLERAEERGEQAVELGADAALALDFFAELAAAHGDCEESYRRFESALRVRATQAFEGVLDRPLELGRSVLPPTYVRDCLTPATEAPSRPRTDPEALPPAGSADPDGRAQAP